MAEFSYPPPDAANLHQAALNYVARYAATRASLRRVLQRRVDRWVRQQSDAETASTIAVQAQSVIESELQKMVKAGAVNDEAFATSRVGGLLRAGRSSRLIRQHLIAKGIDPVLARESTKTDAETELAAALVLTRRRRLGHFATDYPPDQTLRMKHLAILARAGFAREIAERALDMDVDEAEQRIFELRH